MSTTLTLDVTANDKGASRTIKEIGHNVDDTGKKMHNWQAGAKSIALAGFAFGAVAKAAGAVANVVKDSVAAYAEAEQSQLQLQDAFTRFPKLADTNIASLQELNSELMKKTKFDDDAIASGQAVLAQFNLTGKQLKSVTPLLLDYASKTGQDVPSAAGKLGKAFLGNTKALKELGINYKSTGDQAKDTENIIKLLSGAVGGFAEKEGKTAAGRAEILKNTFGEIQEEIGKKVLPVLMALGTFLLEKVIPAIELVVEWLVAHLGPVMVALFGWIREHAFPVIAKLAAWFRDSLVPALRDLAKWFGDNWTVIKEVVIVLAAMAVPILAVVVAMELWAKITKAVAIAQAALNVVMAMNPIVLIIALIAGLVAAIVILWNKNEEFRKVFIAIWEAIKLAIGFVVEYVTEKWKGFVDLLGWVRDRFNDLVGFFRNLPRNIGEALGNLGNVIGNAFKSALNVAIGVINWFIDRANDIIGNINIISPLDDIPKIPKLARLHSGGIVPGAPGSERLAILEAGETVLPVGRRPATAGTVITFAGNTDGAFATAFMKLVRDGSIQIG